MPKYGSPGETQLRHLDIRMHEDQDPVTYEEIWTRLVRVSNALQGLVGVRH